MGKIVQRGVMPILLLAGGIAAVVYGVKYHRRAVFVPQEIEVSLAPPEPPAMAPDEPLAGGPPGFAGPPEFTPPPDGSSSSPFGGPAGGTSPFGAPPPEVQKVTQEILVSKDDAETALVRDVTIGGLVLLGSGDLKRTYSGKPPSLCPT